MYAPGRRVNRLWRSRCGGRTRGRLATGDSPPVARRASPPFRFPGARRAIRWRPRRAPARAHEEALSTALTTARGSERRDEETRKREARRAGHLPVEVASQQIVHAARAHHFFKVGRCQLGDAHVADGHHVGLALAAGFERRLCAEQKVRGAKERERSRG